VPNVFQLEYYQRLKLWVEMRQKLSELSTYQKCVTVDQFWQQAPLVNHYLHFDFMGEWPDPWELLSDNNYCIIARGLGICYTLMMLDIKDIEFKLADNNMGEEVFLVVVDNKYILNYWPNTIDTNKISDFTLKRTISIDLLKQKIK
jgi:hypothetical protein